MVALNKFYYMIINTFCKVYIHIEKIYILIILLNVNVVLVRTFLVNFYGESSQSFVSYWHVLAPTSIFPIISSGRISEHRTSEHIQPDTRLPPGIFSVLQICFKSVSRKHKPSLCVLYQICNFFTILKNFGFLFQKPEILFTNGHF